MQKEQFLEILKKYQDGSASAEEAEFLRTYYNLFELEPEILDSLQEKEKTAIKDRIENRLMEQAAVSDPAGKKKPYRWIAVAASILLILSFGGYFILHKTPVSPQTAQNQQQDIAPGRNQATLTLANGQKIILKPNLRGQIAQQGNTLIQAGSGEAIAYMGTNTPETKVEYNTMATARGEMSPYPLILADGTKVWLNAASSITFPTAFTGKKDREVKVTGEALFEVAHNAAKPFKVLVKGQTIEDIGTEFNVNAYDDEPAMKTTLVKGSIRIGNIILKPGEQALSETGSKQPVIVAGINTSIITAWKDGYFRFDEAQLPVILREISRWYDVDVVYQGTINPHHFKMKVNRNSTLTRALRILATGGVHYHLEGRRLIIE